MLLAHSYPSAHTADGFCARTTRIQSDNRRAKVARRQGGIGGDQERMGIVCLDEEAAWGTMRELGRN